MTGPNKRPVNFQKRTTMGEKTVVVGEDQLMRRFYGINDAKQGEFSKEEDNQKDFYNPIG